MPQTHFCHTSYATLASYIFFKTNKKLIYLCIYVMGWNFVEEHKYANASISNWRNMLDHDKRFCRPRPNEKDLCICAFVHLDYNIWIKSVHKNVHRLWSYSCTNTKYWIIVKIYHRVKIKLFHLSKIAENIILVFTFLFYKCIYYIIITCSQIGKINNVASTSFILL